MGNIQQIQAHLQFYTVLPHHQIKQLLQLLGYKTTEESGFDSCQKQIFFSSLENNDQLLGPPSVYGGFSLG